MNDIFSVQFGGHAVELNARPKAFLDLLTTHLKHCRAGLQPVVAQFHLTAISENLFSISENGSVLFSGLEHETACQMLMQAGLAHLNGACVQGAVFHAAAVANSHGAVILCGASGSGKSTLTAWLLANGFQYLSDEVILYEKSGRISGFARSLVLKPGAAFVWQTVLSQAEGPEMFRFKDGSVWLEPTLLNPNEICTQAVPRLLLFPRYVAGSPLRVTPLTPAESLFRLLQTLVNARNLPFFGMELAKHLARHVTAYAVEYSDLKSMTAWMQQV
ncbi:MAG: hypothetical protein DDG60_10900 [Anaerolineae bacterium]|nr:MAG: hypothetical protein DDG60_10900 [Anaerolineae bacterium]